MIAGRRSRRRPVRYDADRYRQRWRIEATVCLLEGFPPGVHPYDKLAVNFLATVIFANPDRLPPD